MKKLATALMCALALLGAQSVVAGSGKGVVTNLVPTPPVVEVKPLPEKTCRMFVTTETSAVLSPGISVPAQFIQPGCCCGGSGIFIQGITVPQSLTSTSNHKTVLVCD